MEKILFLAHMQPDGSLPNIAREALSAAVELREGLGDASLAVGLIGQGAEGAADSLASCGAGSFLAVIGPEFDVSRYATDAAAIEALAKKAGATLVVAPGTSRFSRALPGAAQRVGGRIDTHISGLTAAGGTIHVQRWYYRQRMVGTLGRAQRPWFLSVDGGIFPQWEGTAGSANVETVPVELDAAGIRTTVIGLKSPSASTQTIRPDADVLFVAGAGWTKKQADGQIHLKEAEQLILDFLKNNSASLGSSKSLVDQSSDGEPVLPFMSHLNQVGQTGSTPRHPKGLATCCHGEEPHAVGWRFINERRAINTDAACGWAQGKADVLYVADAFQVIKRVNELLGA